MSKKIMLPTLAVASAALFVLPTIATANENHVEGATGKAVFGGGPGGNFTASGEPTISFTNVTTNGSFTSETTAHIELRLEGSSATILGVKLSCKSSNTLTGDIRLDTVWHLITIGGTAKPGVLLTPPFPTIICGSGLAERKLELGGNGVIGTVTSPACGAFSNSMTISFTAAGGIQEHQVFTGSFYDLTAATEPSGSSVTAGFAGSSTVSFNDGVSRRLVCT